MKIWYLGHSGFAVRLSQYVLVFDDAQAISDFPSFSTQGSGTQPADLKKIVFVSHRHADHFSSKIFQWDGQEKQLSYVLSDDIPPTEGIGGVKRIGAGQTTTVDGVRIKTLQSTDEGVAYLVNADGAVLYHAGDLNWWHWEGESASYNEDMARRYQRQIDTLKGTGIDVAFVPADPRLGKSALWSMDYLMRTAEVSLCIPMHFWKDCSIFQRIADDPLTEPYRDRVAVMKEPLECFSVTRP